MIKKLYITAAIFTAVTLLSILLVIGESTEISDDAENIENFDDYYADITIDLDEAGFVSIIGSTNDPDLKVQDNSRFTTKKGSYWILNITTEKSYSEYVSKLFLPAGASINYVKSSGLFRIEQGAKRMIITSLGEDEPISIIVQYQIEKKMDRMSYFYLVFGIFAVLCIILFTAFMIYVKIEKKRIDSMGSGMVMQSTKKNDDIEKKDDKNLKQTVRTDNLPHRQKMIIEFLLKTGRPMTQKEIQDEFKLPKSSISRNIHSLELRGLIEKESIGMSNKIKIKHPQ